MSSAAFILFEEGKSIPISQLSSTVKEICEKEHIFFNDCHLSDRYDEAGKLKYENICISNIPFTEENLSRQICLNIYDEPYEYRLYQLEYNAINKSYFSAISFEFFRENGDIFIKIVLPFIKTYPQALFWSSDYFYTMEDLEKIASRPIDKYWCFRDPKDLE